MFFKRNDVKADSDSERMRDRTPFALACCSIALFMLSIFFIETSYGQQRTFYEGFETTEEGELPEGWSTWENGGGQGQEVYWEVFSYNLCGQEKFVMSRAEQGREGMTDEDWLITPKITPAPGDQLMFNTRRSFFETGDLFYVLVSSTTGQAPGAFTDTLAAFTESDLPAPFNPYHKIRLDLSDYVNTAVHFAFVHVSNAGAAGVSGIWHLDEIQVRPLQSAYIEKIYFRQVTSPPQPPPIRLTEDVAIPGSVSVIVNGDFGTVNISSITFSTEGTTDVSLIKRARLFYTPYQVIDSKDIINEIPYGSTTTIGTTCQINGDVDLEPWAPNYFWIVYDLDTTRQLTFPYPQIDVTFEAYVADGVEKIPSIKTIPGARDVVPPSVVNDNFADAIEIMPGGGRFGSSTFPATYEQEFDKFAYCQNEGVEEVHSVWWHFTAPADGVITADLADSKFNTVLVFFDEQHNILACNDDVSATQHQSKIENFPVEEDQKIYIRVSDKGESRCSEYNDSGVVDMQFTFFVTVGIEDNNSAVSALYPNPASDHTYFDVKAASFTGDVYISVTDMIGRVLFTEKKKIALGSSTNVIETSALAPGGYVVRIQKGKYQAVKKLMVVRDGGH